MKKFFPWPGMVIVFILGNIGVCAVTVAVAMRAGDRGVEPEYYQKAMHWDQAVAAEKKSAELGWRIVYESHPRVGQPVRVRVLDAHGEPVAGAKVTLQTFHHTTASKRIEAAFSGDASSGVMSSDFAPDRAGLWQFRWSVDAGGEHYQHEEAVEVLLASDALAHAGGVR